MTVLSVTVTVLSVTGPEHSLIKGVASSPYVPLGAMLNVSLGAVLSVLQGAVLSVSLYSVLQGAVLTVSLYSMLQGLC